MYNRYHSLMRKEKLTIIIIHFRKKEYTKVKKAPMSRSLQSYYNLRNGKKFKKLF